MTKKEMFAFIASTTTNQEVIDFCNHEIALLEKKASTPSKPTANQIENEKIKNQILDLLDAVDAPLTNAQITAELNKSRLTALSPNRVSAIITQLKKAEQVKRTEVKRVAYFSINREAGNAEYLDREVTA